MLHVEISYYAFLALLLRPSVALLLSLRTGPVRNFVLDRGQ